MVNWRVSEKRTLDRSNALTAEDWVKAAVSASAEGGIGAIAVEPLAKKLSVTKGSFYWHFKNRGALLEAVLAKWEEQHTGSVIAAAERIADPRERLVQVFNEAVAEEPLASKDALGPDLFYPLALGRAFEQALSDAADDPTVGPFLRRVSERRVDYLEDCYRALGFSATEAHHRALLAYAAYVGTMRLAREAPSRMPHGEGYRLYCQHLIATLVPTQGTGWLQKIGTSTH